MRKSAWLTWWMSSSIALLASHLPKMDVGSLAWDLSGKRLDMDGVGAVATALMRSTKVTVSMRECDLGPEEAKRLAFALRSNMSVTSVDVSCNRIGDEGAKALSSVLSVGATLTSLNLSRNGIGETVKNVEDNALLSGRHSESSDSTTSVKGLGMLLLAFMSVTTVVLGALLCAFIFVKTTFFSSSFFFGALLLALIFRANGAAWLGSELRAPHC